MRFLWMSLMLFWGSFIVAAPEPLTYEKLQKLSETKELVIIDVYMDWCGPCRKFAPVFQQASDLFSNTYRFFKLDGGSDLDLVHHLGVDRFPTVLFYKGGQEIGRHLGYMDIKQLSAKLDLFSTQN